MEVNTLSVHDENALFDEDDDEDEVVLNRSSDQKKLEKIETSRQRQISAAKATPSFEGLRQSSAGQNIQDIRELMTVPVRTLRGFRASSATDMPRLPAA